MTGVQTCALPISGIRWAILPRDAAYARRCVDLGCKMLSIGLDVWLLKGGLKAVDAEYAN